MASTVLGRIILSHVEAYHKREVREKIKGEAVGRRGLFLSTFVAVSQDPDSRTELLKKYLKKSEENKAKNDKERLDNYYKRNYKDYFEFIEGSVKGKEGELSESEKGILEWLQKNK
ncbi:hypothetical protein RJ641_019177 [Dillenia turbinata]|uniref:Uncharacterized protein n=1 Tax=Dillenia turbinata TaxID=194707 RepID=A0AAN8URT3_9MAGN